MTGTDRSKLLRDYLQNVGDTDQLPDGLEPSLLGLFGEVGSIMAPAKKLHREKAAFVGFQIAAEEEFGDALWYLAAVARRTGIDLSRVFSDVIRRDQHGAVIESDDMPGDPTVEASSARCQKELDESLLALGEAAAALLELRNGQDRISELFESFVGSYLHALGAAQVSFSRVVYANVSKTRGRFVEPAWAQLPNFDKDFENDERLPDRFAITIRQRSNGKSYLEWNGVFIGAPLSDSIRDPDGYRFHDVFHLANAAILHWSPVFRHLIKHKRKSSEQIDEAQDGGRAIVVEEGISAWLFVRAKELGFFENRDRLTFDILKTVQQFVQGFEVEDCPLSLWERAIIQGYEVFRHVRANNGGIAVGDRNARTLKFEPLPGKAQ